MSIYNYINFGNIICSPEKPQTLGKKQSNDCNTIKNVAGMLLFTLIASTHTPAFSHSESCNGMQDGDMGGGSANNACYQHAQVAPIRLAAMQSTFGGAFSLTDNIATNSWQRTNHSSNTESPDSQQLLAATFFLMTITLLLLLRHNLTLKDEIAERKQVQKRLRQASDKIQMLAYTDDLSGMGNRRAFHEQGEEAIKQACATNTPLSLIMIDIDHFKKVNDKFGHLVGDKAIQETAHNILKTVRSNDIHGRIGGEEFAILLPETDAQGAMDLAERIRSEIEHSELKVDNNAIDFTASFGVAAFQPFSDDFNRFMQRADKALYRAKHLGRNRVAFK